jgi:predicted DNA-binding ribbon-helix-helix protein
MMKSPVVKRSIVIAGNKTSVSLEDPFWDALREIARKRHVTVSGLVSSIDSQREHGRSLCPAGSGAARRCPRPLALADRL